MGQYPQSVTALFHSTWQAGVIFELFDDGLHFDNNANDGIFGNYYVGDISEMVTDETIIDIAFDTIGICYASLSVPVKYVPASPKIISPEHNSVIASNNPVVHWTLDPKADGCGIILLDSTPILGKIFGNVLWQKMYKKQADSVYSDTIPISLVNGETYHLFIWSYVTIKFIDDNWRGQAFSIEWASFSIDSTYQQHKLPLSNYPNPFVNNTIIAWNQGTEEVGSLTVYNILGKKVKQLFNGVMLPGQNYTTWDGTNSNGLRVSSGVYILLLQEKDKQQAIKLNIL